MDDLERAILYSFDETGAVAPELKVLFAAATRSHITQTLVKCMPPGLGPRR